MAEVPDLDAPPQGRLKFLLKHLDLFWVSRYYRYEFVLFCLLASFCVVLFWNEVVIPIMPGHQGVYWSRFLGGTKNWMITDGTYLKLPWDIIYIYEVRHRVVTRTTTLLTEDGMNIEVEWYARYMPRKEMVPFLHVMYGQDYEGKLVVPELVSSLRQIIGNYHADKIYAEDEAGLLTSIANTVKNRLKGHPVEVDDVMITRLSLPKGMEDAIVDKLIQEQRLLAYNFRLKSERAEKDRRHIEAESLQHFESLTGISALKWRGVEATIEIAKSPNTKIVLIGTDHKQLPIILNTEPSGDPTRSVGAGPVTTTPKGSIPSPSPSPSPAPDGSK